MNKIVFDAQNIQLAKPARAVVNSESAFVADRIREMGEPELAKQYWNWVCSSPERNQDRFGIECYEQYLQLREIDKSITMPDWGYKGT